MPSAIGAEGGHSEWDFLANSPVESVSGCLESGVPVDARDSNGSTPLHTALWAEQGSVVDLLAAAGTDLDARQPWADSAAHRPDR